MLAFSVSNSRAISGRMAAVKAPGRARGSVAARATLEVGSDLADFPNYYKVLRNQDGDAVTLSSFKGKKPVVLFFYPKAATPGCTAEACGFRDKYGQFTAAGAEVFGISGDNPAENKAFKEAQNLPFDLLTDENNILRKEFNIPATLFVLPGRQTYVIDKNAKCVMSFNDMADTNKHISEALAAVGL